MSRLSVLLSCSLIVLLALPTLAFAYDDAGGGGGDIQLAIGGHLDVVISSHLETMPDLDAAAFSSPGVGASSSLVEHTDAVTRLTTCSKPSGLKVGAGTYALFFGRTRRTVRSSVFTGWSSPAGGSSVLLRV